MRKREFLEFLDAVGVRYLKPPRLRRVFGPEGLGYLHHEIDEISSRARFARVVAERSSKIELYAPLGDELRYSPLGNLPHILDELGIIEALDHHGSDIYPNLTPDFVPAYDMDLLRNTGIKDPEAEVVLTIHFMKYHLPRDDSPAAHAIRHAEERLQHLSESLRNTKPPEYPDDSERQGEERQRLQKRPKVFNGIGKILSGAVAGLGDVLYGLGHIPAPGQVDHRAVIASCALAVGMVSQGLGDLLGE